MNNRMKQFYMSIANQCATLSRARRLQVGSVIVKGDNIISFSWNGMPAGWDNNCEDTIFVLNEEAMGNDMEKLEYQQTDKGNWTKLKTKPEVLHAERNALDKLARGSESGLGATMFITHAPCLECAKSIYGAGIVQVFYEVEYRSVAGIDFLKKCGVKITQVARNVSTK